MRGGPETLEDSAVAEERTKDLRRTDSVGLRLRSVWVSKYLGLVYINDAYSSHSSAIQVFHLLAIPSYVMRPNSTRTSPPHVSPSSVCNSSPLEAMTHLSFAVIVEI